MFRIAKYFFIVFLITTVIPLIAMFLWNSQQLRQMSKEKDQHFLNFGINQLQYKSQQHLKVKKDLILQKHKTALLNLNTTKPYYEIKINKTTNKPELYVSFGSFSEKADLEQFKIEGPFKLEIYAGNDVDKNKLLKVFYSSFLPVFEMDGKRPPHPEHFAPPPFENNGAPPEKSFLSDKRPPHPEHFAPLPFENNEVLSEKFFLTGKRGVPVATIVLQNLKMHMPPHPPENELGLIILFAGSMLSLLTGLYINKNFIKPLLIISNALEKVQKGDLSFEVDTNIKQAEIQNTFKNFNKMVKGLKEKEELRKSFITNLTHDLKTPLIAQERSLKLISKEFEALNLKEPYELAKGIEKNNTHLLRMVNLILESHRFESQAFKLTFADIDLNDLIEDVFEKLKPLALEKNIQLLNLIPQDFQKIKGDITCFKRIFLNLTSNAVENIGNNCKIEVNAMLKDNLIEITVKDNGYGISGEDLPYIFDRYYTGKSDERKIGSGLGLYVCKKLLKLHNGEIFVESQSKSNSNTNSYTNFIIQLKQG